MKKRIAILGFLLVFALFAQVVDMSERTSAQTLLSDDSPELYDAPVPDDYEFEVLAANHTVIGIRPSSGDNFDLEVYTNNTFTTMIDSSTAAGSRVDFVFLNGTEWASPPNRTARVIAGATSYVIEMENDIPARRLTNPWNGTIDSFGNVTEVFDAFELIDITLGKVYTIHLAVPASADLDMFVLNATGDRGEAIAYSTNSGSGVNETTSFTANSTEDIVLVITNENNATGNYTVIPNLAPVVNVSANQTIFEGQTVYVSGNFTDSDMNGNFTYEWDFGDGTIISGTVNSTGNLLVNGDFSDGLNGWNLSIEVPATTTAQIIPQDGTHFNVLDINNPISDADGDWDWAYQDLFLNVTNYTHLYFEADGKAIYQSLSDDGSVGGEYPVHFAFGYWDINGVYHSGIWNNNPWQQGFYYLGSGSYPYSNKVSQNVWFHYKSGNLMEISPKPMIIRQVRVGSSGWAYHGMFDNVKFYGHTNVTGFIEANHTYGDNGIFDVTLTITDSDGASSSDSLVVTVNNIEPMLHPLALVIIDEGDTATFSAYSMDPGSDDLTFTWDWGNSDIADTVVTNFSNPPNPDPYPSTEINPRDVVDGASQVYGDDGFFVISLTVVDDDGGLNATMSNVTVNNLPPSGDPGGPYSGMVNQPVDFSATASDPGSDDLTFTWNWGDGTSDTVTIHYNNGTAADPDSSPAGTFPFSIVDSVQHTYASEGNYTITLTIEDDDGGSVVYNTTVEIVPEPPEEPAEFNWKPIIALIFAIILLLLGIIASHEKPLRFKGILRRDRQYTFLACCLPFVIAEIITGLISLFTDLLPVPPWFGFAMILDLTILIVGIIICVIVLAKGKKPETYGTGLEAVPLVMPSEPAPPPPAPPVDSPEESTIPQGNSCANCGQQLEPGFVVCPNCGTKV
jgi:PKD repeat protein